MAENAQLLMNVSEFTDISSATDTLISAVQAFSYTADETLHVVDILNKIGNSYAISTADLASSLTRSSAALVAAGNTMEEAVALTAAANTIIQDADSVGNALKVVSMRIRGTSTKELSEAGEDTEGLVTNKSKLRTKVKAITGIDILADSGNFKSTYQILTEIANVWENISDTDQAALLEVLAGKTRGSVVAALLQQPDVLKEAYQDAMNAEGSALKENEKYLDSIQGRIDLFNNAVQTMWSNALDDSVIKWFVNLGTELVKIIDNFGLLRTLIIAIGTYIIKKNFGGDLFGGLFENKKQNIDQIKSTLKKLEKARDDARKDLEGHENNRLKQHKLTSAQNTLDSYEKSVSSKIKEYDELQSKITELQNERKSLVQDISNSQANEDFLTNRMQAGYEGAAEALDKAHSNTQKLKSRLEEIDTKIENNTESLKKFKDAEDSAGDAGEKMGRKIKSGAKKAWKEIKKLVKSMLVMTAITAVFELVGKGFELIANKIKENSNAVEKANEEFEDYKSQLSECESELKSLESELKSNQDAIDELMSQGTLTYVEQEELERLKSVTSELENQIGLRKTLKESLQKSTNSSSVVAAKTYLANTSFGSEKSKTERQEEAQEQGEEIGKYAGLGIGATIAAVVALIAAGVFSEGIAWSAIPGVLAASSTSIGAAGGAGYIVGQGVGGAIGSAWAGSNYDQEQNVQDAIKNMKEQRQTLVDAQNEALADKDTEAYNNATEALGNYDKQMATHISQISEYYNSIDWATASDEEKKYARYLGDLLDAYNISMGAAGSKSSAINRIFGAEATDGLKKVKKAWEENTDSTKDFSTVLEETLSVEEYDTFISRLHDMGLYVVDLENYFKEVKAAEDDALPDDLTSVADDINKVTDALDALKSAFDEINEKGYLTVKTFESLKEKFADNSDALAKYANVILSGVSSTEEMVEATEELAKAYIDGKILNGGEVTALERIEYIVQLKELGVTNAEEYVDDKIRENAYKAIKNSATYNYDEVKAAWLDEDSTRTDEDYETALADETIDAWAKAHNYFKDISKEEAQEIADRYGIEIDNIDDVISKLEELANAETELKQAQDNKGHYDEWAENYKKKKEEHDTLEKEIQEYLDQGYDFDSLNTKTYSSHGGIVARDYYIEKNGERIRLTEEEYNVLKDKYEKFQKLNDEFEKLKQEGQNKSTNRVAWVDDNGELSDVVSEEFAKAYNTAKQEKEKLEKEIETKLTAEVKLELELQDKSKLVDDIQSTFDTLASATKEVQENGYFSVDSLQGLLELEPKYLALLYDENGNLNLNKDALYEVAKARLTDLGIQAQQNILENAKRIATEGSISSMRELIDATYDAAEANEVFIQTELASIRAILDKRAADKEDELYGNTTFVDSYMQGVQNQLNAVAGSIQIAKDNIQNTLSSSGNTAKQDAIDAFQKAMTYWENRIAANRARYDQVKNEIDLLEKQGNRAGAEYYQEQIKLEKERLNLLEQQKAEAQKFLGSFRQGSDDWWTAAKQLNDIEGTIDDVTTSIQELSDAIVQIHWDTFDKSHERFSDLIGQLETIRELLSVDEDNLFNDEGEFTETGVAVLGTYIQELEIYKNALEDVNNELQAFQKPYKGNEGYFKEAFSIDSEQEYYEKRKELLDKQQDYSKSISDAQQSIVGMYEKQIDAVEEYTSKLKDSYNDYIDSVKEALQAERD